jgi:hypothetical protein
MKKIKFFDSICFRGELEFLIFRLAELDPYVDNFIIADFSQDGLLKSKWDLIEKWKSKISYISVIEENYLNSIKDEFIKLKPTFEDVLLISNTNEVPNLRNKEPFYEKLDFESFLIEHRNFIWNYEYVDVTSSRGTLVTNLSLILKNKNEFNNLVNMKSSITLMGDKVLNNGWKFSNFGEYDPKYETNIKELLPPDEIDPVRTYPLIKHNNEIELPDNINLLPYFKIGRDEVKKHLFLVESDLEFVNQDYYDTITIINFDSNLKEVLCEKVSEKITKSILYLPNIVLYGDPETFQDEYIMNETKRMFSVVFPQEQDIIEFIYKNEKPLVLGGVSN